MTSLDIPLDDVAMDISNDHIIGLDCPATEPNPNFPSKPNLISCRSPETDPISFRSS